MLFNERGEITETTRANIVLRLQGSWLTPSASSGLLAGVFRQRLLTKGWIEERTLKVSDLEAADRILLVNSVRGFLEVDWLARSESE